MFYPAGNIGNERQERNHIEILYYKYVITGTKYLVFNSGFNLQKKRALKCAVGLNEIIQTGCKREKI